MEYIFTFSFAEILVLFIFIATVYLSGWLSGRLNVLSQTKFDISIQPKLVELRIVIGADGKTYAYNTITSQHVITVDSFDELYPALMVLVRKDPSVSYWYKNINMEGGKDTIQ